MTTPVTDWGQYGLADIWDMVRDDNFDNFPHVKAWQKMQILCHGMADSLKAAAAELEQRWPSDQSPAAAAFRERLQELALTFTLAGNAAGTNGPTLADVNRGFALSRAKLATLCREWEQMEQAEAARVTTARRVLTVGSITSLGLLPVVSGMSDHQVLYVSNTQPARFVVDQAGAPSVPTSWRQDFDSQAREVMAATDREIVEAHPRIQSSPVLDPMYDIEDVWPPRAWSGGGVGLSGSLFTPPPAPTFPAGHLERPPTLEDPILAGGADSGPVGGPGGHFPAGGGSPATGGGGHVPWVMTPRGPAIAPGGVIGERPPSPRAPLGAVPGGIMPVGIGAPARPIPSAAGGGFVAPPGGLIGGAPMGRGAMPVIGAVGGLSTRRRADKDGDWVVPSGIPGVLMPDPEPDVHDPGPGVIGIDR